MKRTSIAVMLMLAVIIGGHGIAHALGGNSGPHTDYRTGYKPSSCSGAACHTVSKGAFLPEELNSSYTTREDWSNFCLTCHNKSGEAHEKSAGTPSNNAYTNFTGLTPGNKGTSHSWKGQNKNAGTRTPESSFLNRTAYMAQAKFVVCETCHFEPVKGSENINWTRGMDQGDQRTYILNGFLSTPSYLNQYIKVYRTSTQTDTPLLQRRDWKQYLVSPSEYTYNNSNATITFSASQGTNYIYVELAEPYLRGSNAANALCVDCHLDRVDTSVSHEPGNGAKDHHPVAVNYGHDSGLNDTLKPSATGNAKIENDQVLCTSCHDPHNAASTDGQILRETDGSALCADCHKTMLDGYSTAGSVNNHNGSRHASPTVCLDCHGTHNSNNIMLVRNVINGQAINFRNFSGPDSFGNENGTSICEVCHTATTHHRASNDTGLGHEAGNNCLECHKHETGFKYSGGGTSGCGSCHPYPGSGNEWPAGNGHLVRYDGVARTHLPTSGYNYQNPNEYTDMVADQTRCGKCHPNIPANHNGMSGGNGTVNVEIPPIWDNCVPASYSSGVCSNVKCHGTHDTPIWY